MSEKKPQKRIVSKGRYVRMQIRLLFICGFSLLCGLFFALLIYRAGVKSALGLSYSLYRCGHTDPNPEMDQCFVLIPLVIVLAQIASSARRKSLTTLRSVGPITDRNAHLLPLQDTLVRSSDLPPTEQQAELLRAAQNQETPPEQLLRMVAGDA